MTPVLATIPIDTLIWIVLLIIGAVGSIASNAKKAARAGAAAQARPAGVAQRPPPVAVQPVAEPVSAPAAPPPIIVPRPRPAPAAPAQPPPMPASAVPHGTKAFRGMFERGNLVGAIVAAEVLGPPKSLREQ